jgi:hypothetical protein
MTDQELIERLWMGNRCELLDSALDKFRHYRRDVGEGTLIVAFGNWKKIKAAAEESEIKYLYCEELD